MKPPSVARQLELSANKPLRFVLGGEQLVHNDFHVTEVKKVFVESLDCGGGRGARHELVIQPWSPKADNARPAMTGEKFRGILTKSGALELLGGEHVRFEYGAAGTPAIQYSMDGLSAAGDTLDIYLTPPHVACKPHQHRRSDELSMVQDSGCCAPGSAGACCA